MQYNRMMVTTQSITENLISSQPFSFIALFLTYLFYLPSLGTSVSPSRLSESAHLLDHCIQEIKLKIQKFQAATNLESPSSPVVECKAFLILYFDLDVILLALELSTYHFIRNYYDFSAAAFTIIVESDIVYIDM